MLENVASDPTVVDSVTAGTSDTLAFELSDEQDEALSLILDWIEEKDNAEFRLGGYAGTGKTTLIKEIMKALRDKYAVGAAAFTGKAVAVLRKKGVHPSSTLHSLLYHAEYDYRTKRMVWTPRTFLPYDIVIVDEASMVSNGLYDDLRRYKVKLLFVGDPAQLEPVGDNPNLMRQCDYVLKTIHRQAEKSPILRYARAIREGRRNLPHGKWGNDKVGHLSVVDSMFGIDLNDYDIVICGKNITRHAVNAKRRVQLGRAGNPVVGESVICLANNKMHGVFNGMTMKITKVFEASFAVQPMFHADLVDDAGEEYYNVPILREFFGKDRKNDSLDARKRTVSIPFDYGYCLTAHKAQGSEWDRVLVIDEPLMGDHSRWQYTAITRAAKELTHVAV